MGRGNKGGVGGFQHQQIPSGDPAGAGATSLLLWVVFIAGLLVVALCRRRKTTQRNTEECRRLMERVKWLRDLLQLLRPSSASSAPPPQMTMEEQDAGAAPTTTTGTRRLHHLRAALAGRLDAAVNEADVLAGSWAIRCCPCGFARCDAVARRLERAKADVDEIYGQVLPVVSRVDATHRVAHMLLGMGALPAHRVVTETTPIRVRRLQYCLLACLPVLKLKI
jgi:hypothetical protein